MNAHRKDPSLFTRWIRPLAVGLAVGVICTVVLLLLMAALIRSVDIPHMAVTPMAVAAAGIGAFTAGLTAAAVAGQRGLICGLLCGVILFLIILLAGFIRYAGVSGGFAMIKLAVLTVAGGLGGILGVGRRKH